MPNIAGYAHAELSVRDLDLSVEWYRELLQAREIFREPNVPEDIVAVALLEPVSKVVIAFTQHLHGDQDLFSAKRAGLDHLAFYVGARDDLDAWAARLEELAIAHDGVQERPGGRSAGLTFRDPDGIVLEFFWAAGR